MKMIQAHYFVMCNDIILALNSVLIIDSNNANWSYRKRMQLWKVVILSPGCCRSWYRAIIRLYSLAPPDPEYWEVSIFQTPLNVLYLGYPRVGLGRFWTQPRPDLLTLGGGRRDPKTTADVNRSSRFWIQVVLGSIWLVVKFIGNYKTLPETTNF